MSPNQVEGNLPVDFAARTASSDREIVWIDLEHKKLFFIRTYWTNQLQAEGKPVVISTEAWVNLGRMNLSKRGTYTPVPRGCQGFFVLFMASPGSHRRSGG